MVTPTTPSHWIVVDVDESGEPRYRFTCANDDADGVRRAGMPDARCDSLIHPGCEWASALNRALEVSADPGTAAYLHGLGPGPVAPPLMSAPVEILHAERCGIYASDAPFRWRYAMRRPVRTSTAHAARAAATTRPSATRHSSSR